MKKQINTLVAVVLFVGAMATSCQDTTYTEVEQTVLEDETSEPTDVGEELEDIPGAN